MKTTTALTMDPADHADLQRIADWQGELATLPYPHETERGRVARVAAARARREAGTP